MIKVLYISRSTLFSSPGGDTVQMLKTKEFLERNFNVIIEVQPKSDAIDYKNFDLIHFFNIIRPNNILPFIKSEIPYVVSPIFVDYSEYDQEVRGGRLAKISYFLGNDKTEYIKSIVRWIINSEHPGSFYYLIRGYRKSIQKVLKNCSALLPNSESELKRLKSDYVFNCEVDIVPNAVDTTFFKEKIGKEKKGVLCVARIEGRKNQLNLIKAIKQTNLHLTIIGNASPNHIEYYKACKRESNNQILFIDHIDQAALLKHYQKARIHAMVSWFETTGLSSLEAAACGCNIVISDKGDQVDYFNKEAFYADPGDVNSIKNALLKADKASKPEMLMQRINENYTWQKTAEQTFAAYKKILE